jgi:hypothetical protein
VLSSSGAHSDEGGHADPTRLTRSQEEIVMPKHRFYRRRFLNRPRYHQGAHVIADVELRTYDDGTAAVDASVHLADCRHCIDIDFDVCSKDEVSNALRKITILREVLDEFETAFTAASEEMLEKNAKARRRRN